MGSNGRTGIGQRLATFWPVAVSRAARCWLFAVILLSSRSSSVSGFPAASLKWCQDVGYGLKGDPRNDRFRHRRRAAPAIAIGGVGTLHELSVAAIVIAEGTEDLAVEAVPSFLLDAPSGGAEPPPVWNNRAWLHRSSSGNRKPTTSTAAGYGSMCGACLPAFQPITKRETASTIGPSPFPMRRAQSGSGSGRRAIGLWLRRHSLQATKPSNAMGSMSRRPTGDKASPRHCMNWPAPSSLRPSSHQRHKPPTPRHSGASEAKSELVKRAARFFHRP